MERIENKRTEEEERKTKGQLEEINKKQIKKNLEWKERKDRKKSI